MAFLLEQPEPIKPFPNQIMIFKRPGLKYSSFYSQYMASTCIQQCVISITEQVQEVDDTDSIFPSRSGKNIEHHRNLMKIKQTGKYKACLEYCMCVCDEVNNLATGQQQNESIPPYTLDLHHLKSEDFIYLRSKIAIPGLFQQLSHVLKAVPTSIPPQSF